MNNEPYKKSLEDELKRVVAELKTVGNVNPKNPNDWEATVQGNIDQADESEIAEKIESFDENHMIVEQLEIRSNEIKRALGRIQDGSYGKCLVCGKIIEEKRLLANPAAETCVEHMQR
ncbi:MAG: TraR/DksA C4-type zinc finger protein [Candidatus Taylorbacteria bacterium]